MSSVWTDRSEKTVEQLRILKEKRDMDRLDLLKSMRFSFGALGQSLAGWMQWVNSPEIMSTFNKEELDEMAKKITSMVEQFVTYDIEITNTGTRKGLEKQRENEQQGTRFVI